MRRHPPRSTHTDPLFSYPRRFRAGGPPDLDSAQRREAEGKAEHAAAAGARAGSGRDASDLGSAAPAPREIDPEPDPGLLAPGCRGAAGPTPHARSRTEGWRVRKEWVWSCRSCGPTAPTKK